MKGEGEEAVAAMAATLIGLYTKLLEGSVPKELENLKKTLFNQTLSNNRLTGDVRRGRGLLTDLAFRHLGSNRFDGAVMPKELGECSNLICLSLSSCAFGGTITLELGHGQLISSQVTLDLRLQGNFLFPMSQEMRSQRESLNYSLQPLTAKDLRLQGVHILPYVPLFWGETKFERQCLIFWSRTPSRTGRRKMEAGGLVWDFDGRAVYLDIREATKNFDVKHRVGVEAVGTVYRAELSTGLVVAAKKLHVPVAEEEEFRREVSALKKIRHRNIVELLGFCLRGDHELLVYEYLEKGSVRQALGGADRKSVV